MATRPSDVICSLGPGEQYLSAKRLAIRRFTAPVPVARCAAAGPSPRTAPRRPAGHTCTLRGWCASHE
eukprot:6222719-Prymnesium_polylepis.1